MLILQEELGSAKSTLEWILQAPNDPSPTPSRTTPRNEHDYEVERAAGGASVENAPSRWRATGRVVLLRVWKQPDGPISAHPVTCRDGRGDRGGEDRASCTAQGGVKRAVYGSPRGPDPVGGRHTNDHTISLQAHCWGQREERQDVIQRGGTA